MITKLILKNWRSHELSEFEFGKGTNVLVGQMGAGKSSVMDSLCFALFGTFPNLQSKKIKLDEVIMNKPSQKTYAEVTVFFTLNNKEYKIVRKIEIGKGTTVSELWEGDKLVEGPQNQRTTEAICNLLKINYDLFSRAVYAEQNNIEYFLEIPKGQRKQKIDELLKISKFEKARKNLSLLTRRLQDRIEEKKKSFEQVTEINEIPSLLKEIEEMKKELEKTREEEKERTEKMNKLKGQYEVLEKMKKEYEETNKKLTELLVKKGLLEEKIKELKITEKKEEEIRRALEEANNKLKNIIEKQEMKKELEKEVNSLKTLLEKYEEEKKKMDERIKELFVIEGLDEIREKAEKQLEEVNKEIQEMIVKNKTLQMKKEEEEKSKKEVLTHEKCPLCYTPLTEEKREEIINAKKEVVDSINQKIAENNEIIQKLEEEKEKIREKIEKIKEESKKAEEAKWVKNRKEELAEEIEKNKKLLEAKEKEMEKLQITGDPEGIRKEIEELEKELEYVKTRSQLEKIREETGRLKEKIASMNYNESLEKALFEQLKELEKQQALLRQKIENITQLLGEKEKRATELKKLKEEIEKNKKVVEKLIETNSSLSILSNVLEKLQTELRQEFTDTTNAALTDIWKRLYPYGDYIDLRLAIDEKGDYVLQAKTAAGKWINVEGIASGGERSTAALALRIAFSLVLTQNLSWLVLDEPTHNLDKEAIRELAVMLKEHLPTIVEQVFIITHEPLLEEAASAFLHRLERNKAEEGPTRVVSEKLY